jgi:ring-1,2-phenylacetyl-CoA epoxidase subunit PaaC
MQNATESPEAPDATTRLIARLADNKYYLGRYYAEWCSGAPTLESAVASAAMAQDELGHARVLYPLLRDRRPEAGAENDPETRTVFANVSFLDESFSSWEDFVAANFLFDGAMTTVFAAATTSKNEPLAARARKVVQEERTHAIHGAAWVRRLAQEGGALRNACEYSLRRILAETLCWLGPEGDGQLAEAQVLDALPAELRTRFLAAVAPTILAEQLDLPIERSGDAWEVTEPLPWGRWDAVRYRLNPAQTTPVSCPFCHSQNTELLSSFGSQLSTEQHYCRSCRTPFEYIRQEEAASH